METSILTSKELRLSSLFYYDLVERKNGFLAKSLDEYKLLLSAAEQASFHFENGDFERFDSLVGENACQIRAIKIAILATKKSIDFKSFNKKISKAKERLEELAVPKRIAHLMSTNVSFAEVLENEALDISLTLDEMFILKSFLLTETKESPSDTDFLCSLVIKEKSMPKNLRRFGNEVSSNFADCITSKLRKLLANASVQFVQQAAIEQGNVSLVGMVSESFVQEHNTLPCIPMFWTYKILLESAKKECIPIIIHAQFVRKNANGYQIEDEEILFFKPEYKQNKVVYTEFSPCEVDYSKPACIVQGLAEISDSEIFCKARWKNKLLGTSLVDVILAGAADHRQYPNLNTEMQIQDFEYMHYQKIAKKKGFSLENPTTFFINHVYPIQIDRIPVLARANSF